MTEELHANDARADGGRLGFGRKPALILTRVSTSGCVRASCVDADSHGFIPIIPREAEGDRHPAPHEANLFDINAKYGDVVSKTETLAYLAGLKG